MTIRLDSTKISTVVKCSHCPWWSAFAFTRTEGWKRGRAHELLAHPGSTQAAKALDHLIRKGATRR